VESQSKWTNFAKEILNISKELFFTLEKLGVKVTLNQISLAPIRDKMARYEAFLNNNAEELQSKHGIDMHKRSFLQQLQGQGPHPSSPGDNSFDEEPLHMQLQQQ